MMDNNLLCKLVGLTKKEPPLVAYLANLNSPLQTERYEEDEIYYDSYTKLGMSFLFDEPHEVLICIFLYAGGVDGFEEYKGDLPNSLVSLIHGRIFCNNWVNRLSPAVTNTLTSSVM
jgi:hypothetical protein